jgi:hypothetical protein
VDDEDGSSLGGAATTRRVVRGRGDGRPSPVAVALLAGLLVAAGIVLTRGDGDPADPGEPDDRSSAPPTGVELEVTKAADVSATYAEAALRFNRSHTFAYRGTVRSAAPNAIRPGAPTAESASVDGAVHLPLSITTEVAVEAGGTAVETVTSGPMVLARRASSVDGLAGAPWETVGPEPDPAGALPARAPPFRLGVALVADVLEAAGDRRNAPRDEAGRRVIRATVPERISRPRAGDESLVDLLSGAEVAITLDDAGDVVRVRLSSAPGVPLLDLDLDIVRLGDPDLVTAAHLADPIRAAVPADVLAAVGLASLELPGLPSTWALTQSAVYGPHVELRPVPPGCGGPVLSIEYHDLAAVAEGQLWISVWRDTCDPEERVGVGNGGFPEEAFTAGRFSGRVSLPAGQPIRGSLTDGTTVVSFSTDLPPEDAAAALASLARAGPGA